MFLKDVKHILQTVSKVVMCYWGEICGGEGQDHGTGNVEVVINPCQIDRPSEQEDAFNNCAEVLEYLKGGSERKTLTNTIDVHSGTNEQVTLRLNAVLRTLGSWYRRQARAEYTHW